MEEVSAYLLARLGGNDKPSKEDVVAILDSVGIKADEAKLNALFADVEKLECSVDDAIAQGMAKLSVIPSGGGLGAAATDNTNENKTNSTTQPAVDDPDSRSESSEAGGG